MSHVLDLSSVLNRLSLVLEEEVLALSEKKFEGLTTIMNRKARCLLEISRTLRSIPLEGWVPLRAEVQKVLDLLHANERALAIHLDAATALGNIIREVLIDQSSDGTYGAARRILR
ncbi:MAG: hypothetical protein Q8M31_14210 [Beijerinckiaceae bacterium]|nr:hypothetical protein [Beijerinckiaceae bacterium]